MKTIFLDTNIYLDYLLQRKNGGFAFKIFRRALKCEFKIIISSKIAEELLGNVSNEEVKSLLAFLSKKIVKAYYSDKDLELAQKLDKENRNDALHAIIAEKHKADFLVTRNIKHFKKFSYKVKAVLPEQI